MAGIEPRTHWYLIEAILPLYYISVYKFYFVYINTYCILQITSGIFISPFEIRKWAFLEVTTGLMSPGQSHVTLLT
jgi:hypothetical protein